MGMFVAEGKSLLCKRGVLNAGDEVTASMLTSGDKDLKRLKEAKVLVSKKPEPKKPEPKKPEPKDPEPKDK